MSDHSVEVVRVHTRPHPNADRLEIAQVWQFQTVVAKGQFKPGDLGAYIPPDSIVNTLRPEFEFLQKHAKQDGTYRLRVSRLRGERSYGLLIPAQDGWKEGDNVAEQLEVTHYEPKPVMTMNEHGITATEAIKAPNSIKWLPKYDIEDWKRYARRIFAPDEAVHITEKIHGANARYSFTGGEMWVGSRSRWVMNVEGNVWGRALKNHPEVVEFCKEHPDWIVYGEVYGKVQSLRYGIPYDVKLMVFDILNGTSVWEDCHSRFKFDSLPWVPKLYDGRINWENVQKEFAEGPSTVPGADHVREGCVIKPIYERTHPLFGRVQLKLVGDGYYDKT